MDRTISVEEKIRRAEEIYERRRQGINKPIATVNVNNKEKKDIKLLKKMIIQLLICMSIYFVIYTIKNNQYVFSEDFTNKLNEILSYDTNFVQLYNYFKEHVFKTIDDENNNEQTGQEAIGGAIEETNGENVEDEKNSENQEAQEKSGETKELSQAEQDIINVKNTTNFIKPIEGIISSKYGRRDSATGTVPKNHTGTDIAANLGTKIKSATDGEVVLSSQEGDYGKHLKIQIGEVSIIYAHCNQLYVKQGDKITQGQEIAEVGSTGNSTRTTFTF